MLYFKLIPSYFDHFIFLNGYVNTDFIPQFIYVFIIINYSSASCFTSCGFLVICDRQF